MPSSLLYKDLRANIAWLTESSSLPPLSSPQKITNSWHLNLQRLKQDLLDRSSCVWFEKAGVLDMITQEENQLLTQTGRGTPAGALLRRYWQPVALSEELPQGGAPLAVKILGEDLVLFRDDMGRGRTIRDSLLAQRNRLELRANRRWRIAVSLPWVAL